MELMTEDIIQFPDVNEMKEMLLAAREDIQEAAKADPDMKEHSQLVMDVISVIEEKIAGQKDLAKLAPKEKIFLAAHINFFQTLLEDLFMDDEFEDDLEDEEDLEEVEEEK